MTDKQKKLLYVIYLVLLVVGLWYVRYVLNRKDLKLTIKATEQSVEQPKPISASLIIDDGKSPKTYKYGLKSSDSVNSLLEKSRGAGDLYYEVIDYVSNSYLRVNDQPAPQGFEWRIFYNSEDLTVKRFATQLTADGVYTLKLTRISTIQ